MDSVSNQSPDHAYDPNYNPLTVLQGTRFEQNPTPFLDDPNEATTRARMAQSDKEVTDAQTLSASGWAGTIAGVGAGLLDPSYYLPIAGELHAAEEGGSFVRSALRTAAGGAAQSAVSEAAFHASQENRTWKESAGNIATNTLLMGLLGGAIGTLSRPERDAASEALEAARRDATPVNPLDPSSMSLHDHITPGESGFSQGVERRAAELHAAGVAQSPLEAAEAAHIEQLPEDIAHAVDGGEAQAGIADAAERGGTGGQSDPEGRLGEPGSGFGEAGGDGGAAEPVAGAGGTVDAGVEPAPSTVPDADNLADRVGGGVAQPVGAAASDTRDLIPKGYGLNQVSGVKRLANALSPNLRVYHNASAVARRALAGLAETAIRFTQHDRGVPTSIGGAPLETIVRQDQAKFTQTTHHTLESAWTDHRYGGDKPGIAQRAADAIGDARGQTPAGKLSYRDFKAAVYDAMYSGDQHPIPQVQQAARDLRAQVYDPIKKMLQETLGPDGRPMLGEELDAPAGDQSFVPRGWNKEAVTAKRYDLKQRFTNWLASEQATKSAAKERIAAAQAQHEALGTQVQKLEGRLETIRGRQEDTTSRLKERASAGATTDDRLDTVADRAGHAREALDELDEFVSTMQGNLRDPDALAHLADLKAQQTQLRADIAGHGFNQVEKAGIMHAETEELRSIQGDRTNIGEAIDSARADRQTGRDRLRVAAAREDEAGIAARQNRGRVGLLQDRLSRQQTMEDLLDAARQNAEDQRTALRTKMEAEVRAWKGNSTADAMRALKARDEAERVRGLKQEAGVYNGKGDRLTSADGPVDRSIKRILNSDRDLDHGELSDRADEMIDRIISSPDGRIPYDIASGGPDIGGTGGGALPRGSLNARDFAIPTAMVKDFIHRDMEHVTSSFMRTMLPDLQLTRRFGDVDMTQTMREIQEEYARKIGPDTTEAQARDINAMRNSDIKDIAAVRDRLRGVYGWTPGSRTIPDLVRDFRNATSLASLGTSVANRFNDTGAQAVFRYGLQNVFNDAWRPFFKSMLGMSPLAGVAKKQAAEMGIGIDGLLGHLRHNLSDINESYMPGNKFSRGLAYLNDRSMLVNMHGPWTDWMKAMTWVPAQAEFGRVADRIAGGTATKRDLQTMADANIDPHMATRISQQIGQHSITVDGVRMATAGKWTDLGARDAFERALAREANINVITAGIGDKPLFLSTPIGGMLGQFKGFVAGAHERILISNLQQRDGRSLQGMLTSLAMGMVSYRLYTLLSGQEASPRPQDWIKEGLHRSALTGWLSEANNDLAKFTSGKLDYNRLYGADRPLTRRQDNSPLSELLGPTYARIEGLTGAVTHTIGGHATSADLHQVRMAVPLQNLMGVRRLIDSAEDGVATSLGMKPRSHAPQTWAP